MKKYYFLLLGCMIGLSACNVSVTTQTPATTQTPIKAVTSTPSVESTQTSAPLNFSPILYGWNSGSGSLLLLGGVQEDTWLGPETASAQIRDGSVYDLYSSDVRSQATGGIPAPDPICDTYFIDVDENISVAGMTGVAQGWQVTQRNMEELSSENEFYQGVVTQWLIEEGILDPVIEHLRVLRVDIEGDGVDEVFISASHFSDESGHMIESGDYTVILMRKVNGDDVETLDLVGKVYPSQELEMTFPITYSLANFMDLNQDGNLEVIIDIERWEGFGAAVYQINGLDRVQVLQAFCGS